MKSIYFMGIRWPMYPERNTPFKVTSYPRAQSNNPFAKICNAIGDAIDGSTLTGIAEHALCYQGNLTGAQRQPLGILRGPFGKEPPFTLSGPGSSKYRSTGDYTGTFIPDGPCCDVE